jgi:hypothetical protein
MDSYELKVAFTEEQLTNLYITGSNVIIAKPLVNGPPDVTWQVFKPIQNNTLKWNEEYGMYASTSEVINGSELNQFSSVPVGAVMDKLYTLEPSAVISGPASGGQPNSFTLLNKYSDKPYLTMGLFQDATVNGTIISGNALSADYTLLASTAFMTPFTTVYIWLQSQIKSNSIVTVVTSPLTKLRFEGDIKNLSVKYDSSSGEFINNSDNKEIDAFIGYISVSDANRMFKTKESW